MPHSYSEIVPIVNKDEYEITFNEILRDIKYIVTNEIFSYSASSEQRARRHN